MRYQCYISGPINGYPNHNRIAFAQAEFEMQGKGWNVINPTDLGQMKNATWTKYMERDIAYVFSSQLVVALPGWELSRGARLEIHTAMENRIQVLPLAVAREWRPEDLLASITH
jgi:hypothetical protein